MTEFFNLFVHLTPRNVRLWNVCVTVCTAGLHIFSCVKIFNGVDFFNRD